MLAYRVRFFRPQSLCKSARSQIETLPKNHNRVALHFLLHSIMTIWQRCNLRGRRRLYEPTSCQHGSLGPVGSKPSICPPEDAGWDFAWIPGVRGTRGGILPASALGPRGWNFYGSRIPPRGFFTRGGILKSTRGGNFYGSRIPTPRRFG